MSDKQINISFWCVAPLTLIIVAWIFAALFLGYWSAPEYNTGVSHTYECVDPLSGDTVVVVQHRPMTKTSAEYCTERVER